MKGKNGTIQNKHTLTLTLRKWQQRQGKTIGEAQVINVVLVIANLLR